MLKNKLKIDDSICFQFKTSFSSCTVFHLLHYHLEAIKRQLTEMTARAPNFFQGTPVIIDLEKLNPYETLDFVKLKTLLLANNLVVMGVRGGSATQQEAALAASLPLVKMEKTVNKTSEKEERVEHDRKTLVLTHPIRSGMQVYAKDTDLIVTNTVSSGAEIAADGHIHVYGSLRGRALAGAKGNQSARIFCCELQAELISIAGYYLTQEDIQAITKKNVGGVTQIYLENEQIRIEAI